MCLGGVCDLDWAWELRQNDCLFDTFWCLGWGKESVAFSLSLFFQRGFCFYLLFLVFSFPFVLQGNWSEVMSLVAKVFFFLKMDARIYKRKKGIKEDCSRHQPKRHDVDVIARAIDLKRVTRLDFCSVMDII